MLEIKGNVNTAICYAKIIEDEAVEQIKRMCDYEFTKGSIVGVDIGCGMYTVKAMPKLKRS